MSMGTQGGEPKHLGLSTKQRLPKKAVASDFARNGCVVSQLSLCGCFPTIHYRLSLHGITQCTARTDEKIERLKVSHARNKVSAVNQKKYCLQKFLKMLKLVYIPGQGRAKAIRYILLPKGVEFEDLRHPFEL